MREFIIPPKKSLEEIRKQTVNEASKCKKKRKHFTEAGAKEVAKHQMKKNQNLKLEVYKCNFCTGWHLTRKKQYLRCAFIANEAEYWERKLNKAK